MMHFQGWSETLLRRKYPLRWHQLPRAQGYHEYIDDNLPPESPYLYGLHPNAEIGFLTVTSERLFRTVLEMQPKESDAGGGAGVSREEKASAASASAQRTRRCRGHKGGARGGQGQAPHNPPGNARGRDTPAPCSAGEQSCKASTATGCTLPAWHRGAASSALTSCTLLQGFIWVCLHWVCVTIYVSTRCSYKRQQWSGRLLG